MYIGNKGYTILKSSLSSDKEKLIKKDLTITPFTLNASVSFAGQNTGSYPIYRENNNKIYVPQYYGRSIFGNTDDIRISEGDDINLTFNGELRDYQKPVMEKTINYFIKQLIYLYIS